MKHFSTILCPAIRSCPCVQGKSGQSCENIKLPHHAWLPSHPIESAPGVAHILPHSSEADPAPAVPSQAASKIACDKTRPVADRHQHILSGANRSKHNLHDAGLLYLCKLEASCADLQALTNWPGVTRQGYAASFVAISTSFLPLCEASNSPMNLPSNCSLRPFNLPVPAPMRKASIWHRVDKLHRM